MSQQQRLALVAIVAFCCLFSNISGETTPIKLDVYYESLCPDSIYFITKELGPVYNDFKQYLDVTLVPFGKASWIITGQGKPHFTCQHGPDECEGNRAQACAIHEIQQIFTNEAEQQQKSVEIVDCAMARRGYASTVTQCAKSQGFSDESIERIKTCTNNELGDQLLMAQGAKTQTVGSPQLSFVPTIVINGAKSQSAFRNFSATICKLIGETEKPEICSHVQAA